MKLSPQDPKIFNMQAGTAAAHFFADNQKALVDTVSNWLAEQKL